MSRRKIDDLLADGHARRSALQRLVARAEDRESWTRQLRALLPSAQAAHYDVANLRHDRLVVHASNASWATRLKFQVPHLLPKLRQLRDFANVESVRIRATRQTDPSTMSVEDACRPAPRPSPPPRDALLALADDCNYEELKHAILRLAQHSGTRPASHKPDDGN